MAERRPPGFNVDLGFYDSEEVLSIPRKIRAAAIGVWTLCGCYSANKLSDGYVPAEALRDRGCTPAIRTALLKTEPTPLWEDAGNGAIQFTRWPKWQRTAAEIKAYREAEAERKRKAREAKKSARDDHVDATRGSRDRHVDATWSMDEAHVAGDMDVSRSPDDDIEASPTSTDKKVSGWTSGGHRQDVRTEDGDPKTETETETETELKNTTHLDEVYALNVEPPRANLSAPVSQSASRLVNDIVGTAMNGYSGSVLTKLRINASQLMNEVGAEVTAEALRVWKSKPHLGPDVLSSLTAEAAKTIAERNNGPTNVTAFERKKAQNANVFRALGNDNQRPELLP